MNLEKNGLIKWLCLIMIMVFAWSLQASRLNIFNDHNRFLDNDGNTIHHFNYKIPNNSLSFEKTEDGFMATLDVTVSVQQENGEKTQLQEFTRYIGVEDKQAALSASKYYLDKITLTLSKAEFMFLVDFEDRNSGKTYNWALKLDNLDPGSLVSDIEFSHEIVKGDLLPGFEQFQRGDYQFYVDPAHIYQKNVHDSVFIYYEIQNISLAEDGYAYVAEDIHIYNERDTLRVEKYLSSESALLDRIHSFSLDELSPGYYNIDITVEDEYRNIEGKASDYFVISQKITASQRLFHDTQKEHKLLRYFLPSSYFRNWDSMSQEAKANLIDRFWRQNDPNPHTDHNAFLQLIRERVNYANNNFTHFQDGWETDRGRIWIRNGEPDEMEKDHLEGDMALTRREYQIWRYRDLNRVYLFVDIQGTGNYRLIYNRNDDMEHTAHDWDRYVGEEFDKAKLEQ